MITALHKLTTRISQIQEIPIHFFQKIESSVAFGDHLFPAWSKTVFAQTDLKKKFEAIYNKYKSIKSKANRDFIVTAFSHTNQIENLCDNQLGIKAITLNDLPESIRKEIDDLFLYLYNTAINYHVFNTHATDTVKDAIDRFIITNQLEVCPFCGLEGFLNIDGQARIALDHWLCKDIYPMVAVNFDNLVPIGSSCNNRPVKGSKNILVDDTNNRIIAFYPYKRHSCISVNFYFKKEPSIGGIKDNDWVLECFPNDNLEQDIFKSWVSIMNISDRYLDYIRKIVFAMWESNYKKFIDKHPRLIHAQNINELRQNFEEWKSTFDIKGRVGSILWIPFIDYLINKASDTYLYGLCENFRR